MDEQGRYRDGLLVAKIQQHCLQEASQICHHPKLEDKRATHLCCGVRDFQLQIFYRLGVLVEPINEQWESVKQEITATSF